ncbi:MAG: hypothetical protein JRJ38_13120 [Deltaproteobacteria bacterium]|nr:hypothetical protein [Deltaproteobacteria bacterium]
MKTHSLAKALRKLSGILESYPNTELSNFGRLFEKELLLDKRQVAVSLKNLFSLSKISRKEWINLIDDYGFIIDIKPRDSARNIIGKLFNYLETHPEAIDILKRKSRESDGKPSALVQALDILLEDI